MAKRSVEEKDASLGFEESLGQLQQIVEDLEEGTGGLERSMQRFEQGIGLLRACYKTLESAEQKIELLTSVDEQGQVSTEAFDATSSVERKRKQSKKQAQSDGDSDPESADDATGKQRLF